MALHSLGCAPPPSQLISSVMALHSLGCAPLLLFQRSDLHHRLKCFRERKLAMSSGKRGGGGARGDFMTEDDYRPGFGQISTSFGPELHACLRFKLVKTYDQVPIDVFKRITDEDAAKVIEGLALKVADRESAIDQVKKLYKLFCECDCTLLEINPLAETADNKLVAADAKLNFDDNAGFRQKAIFALRDPS